MTLWYIMRQHHYTEQRVQRTTDGNAYLSFLFGKEKKIYITVEYNNIVKEANDG